MLDGEAGMAVLVDSVTIIEIAESDVEVINVAKLVLTLALSELAGSMSDETVLAENARVSI